MTHFEKAAGPVREHIAHLVKALASLMKCAGRRKSGRVVHLSLSSALPRAQGERLPVAVTIHILSLVSVEGQEIVMGLRSSLRTLWHGSMHVAHASDQRHVTTEAEDLSLAAQDKQDGGEATEPSADEGLSLEAERRLEVLLRGAVGDRRHAEEALRHLTWSPATVEAYLLTEYQGYDRNCIDIYVIEFADGRPQDDQEGAILQSWVLADYVDRQHDLDWIHDTRNPMKESPLGWDERRLEPTYFGAGDRIWNEPSGEQLHTLIDEPSLAPWASSTARVVGPTSARDLSHDFEHNMFENDLTDAHLQAIRHALSPFMGTELVELEYDEWAGWCRSWVGVHDNMVLIMYASWLFD